MCSKIFPVLKWAGYLPEWPGPQEGERPVAYLIQCLDTAITKDPLCDDGLQLQAITLGYTAKGLAGCIIKAFNAAELSHILSLPDNLIPRYVVAIGYPIEKQVIIDMKEDEKDAFKYFRDENGTHYVPKRQLSELIIK